MSKRTNGISKLMWRRMVSVMLVMTFVCSSVLIVRLVNIQFIQSEYYQEKAINQQLSKSTINPSRGTIYDRNMQPLAQSASVWSIGLEPVNIKNEEQRALVADGLAEILEMDREKIYEKAGNKKVQYEVLKKKVERPVFEKITKFAKDNKLNCIVIDPDTKRYYPAGSTASTLLGFTGDDNNGLSGIEANYERYLKGVPGKVVVAKNALGTNMPFSYETMIDPQNGSDLVLTIDSVIQGFLERRLELAVKENNVANRATGIIMNVKTGEIYAMATKNDFDPNDPFTITNEAKADALAQFTGTKEEKSTLRNDILNEQWRNKAISDPYEPGSVFKSVTAAMALDEKVVKESDAFTCTGSLKIGGWDIRCNNRLGHGHLNFLEGLQQSCNPVFMKVGERVGSEKFSEYFESFGFTEKTGIDLPGEATGIYHTKEQMGVVELATSSFGQTFKVTPVQMITAMSAIANGGSLLEPYVVKQMLDENENIIESHDTKVRRQVISAETSSELCRMLESVVSEGGAKNAYIPGYRMAGKTGTSEKRDAKEPGLRIASFCGFAPADDPEVAILIILDEPHAAVNYGGTIAAPVARDIMADVLTYLGVEPKYTPEELEGLDINTPSVWGESVKKATGIITAAGLKPKVIGDGDTVKEQIPSVGMPIPKDGTVVIYTSTTGKDNQVEMPDLTGMTVSEANAALVNLELNIRLSGVSLNSNLVKVYRQDVMHGEKVPKGTVVKVYFREVVADDAEISAGG